MLDIFDILGPVMVGPSSSHTAGAVRIGRMARTLLGAEVARADIGLHGSFADTGQGHGTDRALVAGLRGMKPDDLGIPESFAIAANQGLEFRFHTIHLRDAHPNTAVLEVESADGRKLTLQAQRRGVKLRQLTAGDCASPCPGLTARALSPRWGQAEDLAQAVRELFYTQEPERFRERLTALDGAMNNYSLVLSLEHQGARALLPGDANAAACGQIDPELLSADLFKVGHHGQRDGASRELIAAIRPKVVVCCASSDRRYQSADPELLQMIAASGARLCFSDCPPVPREIPAPPPHRAVQIVLTGGRAPEITYFTKEGDVCHGGI